MVLLEDDDDLATFLDPSEFGEVFILPGGKQIVGLWNAAEDVDLDIRGLFIEATFREVDVSFLPTKTEITRLRTSKTYRVVDRKPDGLNGVISLRLEGDA